MKKFLMACCVIVALAWATGAMAQDANYTVKPGDMLSISVWKEPDLQTAGAGASGRLVLVPAGRRGRCQGQDRRRPQQDR